MKKLSCILFASFILVVIFSVLISGRGYTKDNLAYKLDTNEKIVEKEFYYFDTLRRSVVQILACGETGSAFGTGFFIDENKTIITNYHVIREAEKVYIMFKEDEYAYRANVLYFDEENDIAILTSNYDFEFNYLPLTFDTKINETIYTCGFSTNYNVTHGNIIDNMAPYKGKYYIDITNIVYSGNSGGPALNKDGEVVGVVTLGNSVSTSLVPSYKVYNAIHNLKNES